MANHQLSGGPVARPGPTPPPTLAMPQLVAIDGQYPQPGPAENVMGMIQSFAGSSAWGAPPARGQRMLIPQNQALFSLLGTAYGFADSMHFDLPNLRGRTIVGGNPGMMGAGTLAMTAMIAAVPGSGGPPVGAVAFFAGNGTPGGWLAADGSPISAAKYTPLFETIGTVFGGRGPVAMLPNLQGRAAIGVGQSPGQPPVTLGEIVSGPIPALGLEFIICAEGELPPASGSGGFPPASAFVGQVFAYAGQSPPPGWLLADGSLQSSAAYPALFELIGTTYGGDGQTDFALPNLRGRMIAGT